MALFLCRLVVAFGVGFFVRDMMVRMVAAWYRWRQYRLQREILHILEHQRRFPGRCTVCAFHRYGVAHGFQSERSMAAPHHCPEVN